MYYHLYASCTGTGLYEYDTLETCELKETFYSDWMYNDNIDLYLASRQVLSVNLDIMIISRTCLPPCY